MRSKSIRSSKFLAVFLCVKLRDGHGFGPFMCRVGLGRVGSTFSYLVGSGPIVSVCNSAWITLDVTLNLANC